MRTKLIIAVGGFLGALIIGVPVLFVVALSAPGRAAAVAAPLGSNCTITAASQNGGLTSSIPLDAQQVGNARIIVGVARGRALPEQAAAIALMTAMQESGLRNLDHGDRDSLGLFQQRPSQGWGTQQQLMDPIYASSAFLDRLVQVPNWESIPMWQAAQAVQRSADGTAYTRWQAMGTELASALYGDPSDVVTCQGGTLSPTASDDVRVNAVLTAAQSMLGQPYVWGGGDEHGPTGGLFHTNPPGFDCSGLVIYAFASIGVDLPHSSVSQYGLGRHIPVDQAVPGDLIFLSSTGTVGGIHHVAIVRSAGEIIEAQDFGIPVHVRSYRGPAEPEIMPDAVRLIT